jgi:hypothetical protein
MRAPLAAVLVATILVAGCSGKPQADAAGVTDFSDFEEDLEATESTGVIRGVVVDQAINPLAGARVEVTGLQRNTTTDGNGRFGFDDLAPGDYFLSASKPGYTDIQQTALVVAGVEEPKAVRIMLQAVPGSLPYFVPYSYTGFVSCSFKAANYVFRAGDCDPTGALGYRDRDDSHPVFVAENPPLLFQSEITWEHNQDLGESLVTIQVACENEDCSGGGGNAGQDTDLPRVRFCNTRGVAPLICRVTQEEPGGTSGYGLNESHLGDTHKSFEVAVYANCYQQCVNSVYGLGLVFEQKFDLFAHAFYNYEPPEDWTFIATGAVPEPPGG